jgi:Flp pilus assembly pilin Flp
MSLHRWLPEIPYWRMKVKQLLQAVWTNDKAEDIAEYAVMLAVILVIVVGTIRLIGSQANNVFSQTASAIGNP